MKFNWIKSLYDRAHKWLTEPLWEPQEPIKIKIYTLEEQIAFLKQGREILLSNQKAEITLDQSHCDMLLNIEASLLTSQK